MISHPLCAILSVISLFLLALRSEAAALASDASKHTYVIVHGAWGGGWDWKQVDRLLTADGHIVYRPTLTGLGERAHLASREVGLSTHVKDVINVILYEDLHNVVLVGHSYAGMVITGVIDQIPDRIRHVIYLDAFVPEDGESANDGWRLMGRNVLADRNEIVQAGPFAIKVEDGFMIFVGADLSKSPPSEVPQSVKTWTEPVSFKNPSARTIPGTAVWFVEKGEPHSLSGTPGEPLEHRVRARGWENLFMESDHLAERTHPRELATLLEQVVKPDAEAELRSQPKATGAPRG